MLETKVSLRMDDLEELSNELLDAIDQGLGDNVDRGFQCSQELISEQSFDQGVLLRSGYITKKQPLERFLSYDALHALIIAFGATYKDKMPPLQVIYEWVRRHQLQATNPEALIGIKR